MRWLGAVLACVALLGVGTSSQAAKQVDRCPPAQCRDHVLPRVPGVTVDDTTVRVILPEGYAASGKRYPVVYLLHGALGGYREWTTATPIAQWARTAGAIFVLPEGGHARSAGWYSDWHDGSYQWETWHVDHVLPFVDRRYRTLPFARAVVGASMGANGALTLAARNPGSFQVAVALSGWVDTQLLTPLSGRYADAENVVPVKLSRVWGDQVLDADEWAAHNPTALASRLRGTTVITAVRTGDPQEQRGGSGQAFLFSTHPTFFAALETAGVEHVERVERGGGHDWPWFWQDAQWALPQVLDRLGPARR